MSKIERTSAVGLFNYARSYWRSGEHLLAAKLKLTHAYAPVVFLLSHAIELYLKAFLLSRGLSVKKLRGVGHKVIDLGHEASARGLSVSAEDFEVLSSLGEINAVIRFRYLETGFLSMPTEAALSETCKRLDPSIALALHEAGELVRLAK